MKVVTEFVAQMARLSADETSNEPSSSETANSSSTTPSSSVATSNVKSESSSQQQQPSGVTYASSSSQPSSLASSTISLSTLSSVTPTSPPTLATTPNTSPSSSTSSPSDATVAIKAEKPSGKEQQPPARIEAKPDESQGVTIAKKESAPTSTTSSSALPSVVAGAPGAVAHHESAAVAAHGEHVKGSSVATSAANVSRTDVNPNHTSHTASTTIVNPSVAVAKDPLPGFAGKRMSSSPPRRKSQTIIAGGNVELPPATKEQPPKERKLSEKSHGSRGPTPTPMHNQPSSEQVQHHKANGETAADVKPDLDKLSDAGEYPTCSTNYTVLLRAVILFRPFLTYSTAAIIVRYQPYFIKIKQDSSLLLSALVLIALCTKFAEKSLGQAASPIRKVRC